MYKRGVIQSWVGAHANLPARQGGLAKADVALRSNKTASVGPPDVEGFLFIGTHLAAFADSAIPRRMIEAYLATEYRIGEPSRFVVLIGRRHHGLAALLAGRNQLPCAAILTAWNPLSQRTRRSENERAQARLIRELDRQQLPHFPGYGADSAGKWPVEDSRLVLNVKLKGAAELARRFRQNGFVWIAGDALPMLVLLH